VRVTLVFAHKTSGEANMQILRDKIKADKKLVVAANMDLTDAEAKSSGRSTRATRRRAPD